MKLFFMSMMLFSINAFASFDCVSADSDKLGYRIVVVERIGAASTVTIQYKGKNVYHKAVVESGAGTGMSYSSLNFTNKNNAPARLFVSVYRNGSQILGHFNEGSFVPVVPYLELQCKQY